MDDAIERLRRLSEWEGGRWPFTDEEARAILAAYDKAIGALAYARNEVGSVKAACRHKVDEQAQEIEALLDERDRLHADVHRLRDEAKETYHRGFNDGLKGAFSAAERAK